MLASLHNTCHTTPNEKSHTGVRFGFDTLLIFILLIFCTLFISVSAVHLFRKKVQVAMHVLVYVCIACA